MADYRAVLLTVTGEVADITPTVAMIYDLLVCSMDWGSGFLETEEMEAVANLGRMCGFDIPTCQATYSNYGDTYKPDGDSWGKCEKDVGHKGKHGGKVKTRRFGERTIARKPDSFDPVTGHLINGRITEPVIVQDEKPMEWD